MISELLEEKVLITEEPPLGRKDPKEQSSLNFSTSFSASYTQCICYDQDFSKVSHGVLLDRVGKDESTTTWICSY